MKKPHKSTSVPENEHLMTKKYSTTQETCQGTKQNLPVLYNFVPQLEIEKAPDTINLQEIQYFSKLILKVMLHVIVSSFMKVEFVKINPKCPIGFLLQL